MFKRICVADMADSLFENPIGKVVWPVYAVLTIAITIVAALGGKFEFVRKIFLNLEKRRGC